MTRFTVQRGWGVSPSFWSNDAQAETMEAALAEVQSSFDLDVEQYGPNHRYSYRIVDDEGQHTYPQPKD